MPSTRFFPALGIATIVLFGVTLVVFGSAAVTSTTLTTSGAGPVAVAAPAAASARATAPALGWFARRSPAEGDGVAIDTGTSSRSSSVTVSQRPIALHAILHHPSQGIEVRPV